MTIRTTMLRTAALAAIAGNALWTMGASLAQIDAAPEGATLTLQTQPDAGPIRIEKLRNGNLAINNVAGGKNDLAGALDAFVRSPLEEYRTAADDAGRNAALAKLTAGFGDYFDRDMVRREGEVTKIQERLVKLQQLLERRRAKKQEFVELQVKVAIAEAEGMGFYENSGEPASRLFFGKRGQFGEWNGASDLARDILISNANEDASPPATDAAADPIAAPIGTTESPIAY